MQVYEAIITEIPSTSNAGNTTPTVTLLAPFFAGNPRHAEQIVIAKESYRFNQPNMITEVSVRPFVGER